MKEKLEALKAHVGEVAANPEFVHYKWFVKWHLEIVEKIALELAEHYPEADRELVRLMAWMHDYGKIIDFDRQYEMTRIAGKPKLLELGFDEQFAERVMQYIEILDSKMTTDIKLAPIEVQIISSADGCSHLVGPFMSLWWYENSDKSIEELMADNIKKATKDWERKIVLPEARQAFQAAHNTVMLQGGQLPESFLDQTK